jgi:hypothetical protein
MTPSMTGSYIIARVLDLRSGIIRSQDFPSHQRSELIIPHELVECSNGDQKDDGLGQFVPSTIVAIVCTT